MKHSPLTRAWLALPVVLTVAAVVPARADRGRPIDRASQSTGPDGSPLKPADYRELEQMEKSIADFEGASRDYRGTVSHIVRQEFERKRRVLNARYDGRVHDNEVEEKSRRADAIALFEKWLQKYPRDKRWTPDVVFRLAELYFERSNDEYLAAVDAASRSADAAMKAGNPDAAATVRTMGRASQARVRGLCFIRAATPSALRGTGHRAS